MKIVVPASKINGQIDAIASKSYAHRLLICAALADRKTNITCKTSSEDIEATALCLDAFLASVTYIDGKYTVIPLERTKRKDSLVLNCKESGSTYRFLLPVVCALGKQCEFLLSGRLPKRPMDTLWTVLESHGITIDGKNEEKVTVCGQLEPGLFTVSGNISSQYITGLILALPLLCGDSKIVITDSLESKGYIDITLSVIKLFGIRADVSGNTIYIKGNQKYISPDFACVEGDWSNSAFWLCAAAAGGFVTVTGLSPLSCQGDKAVCDILRRFGATVTQSKDAVTVKSARLCGIEIDAAEIPDLVPALSVAAAGAMGKTVFYNAGRLRFKESDRLYSISRILSILGADTAMTSDKLIISGNGKLDGGAVNPMGDHRIAMMAAAASVICQNNVVIQNAECVAKSYPQFFEDFRKLGSLNFKEE